MLDKASFQDPNKSKGVPEQCVHDYRTNKRPLETCAKELTNSVSVTNKYEPYSSQQQKVGHGTYWTDVNDYRAKRL